MSFCRTVLLLKLLRDLKSRKGSLLALIAIVALGVGCYIGMAGTYRDLMTCRDRYYEDNRLADFSISFKRAPEWIVDEVLTGRPLSPLGAQ